MTKKEPVIIKSDTLRKNDVLSTADKVAILPRLKLTDRQLYELELILNEGFAPLKGFMNEDDYRGVVLQSRLADGTLWPIPIVLDVPFESEFAGLGNEIVLTDGYGNPLAILRIESVYTPDREVEARYVYGTTDVTHPGVNYLYNETKPLYIGGTVEQLRERSHPDFSELRRSPKALKEHFKKLAKKKKDFKVVAFQTRNPIHRAHFELIKRAADLHQAHVLIHPAVGPTKTGDIDYVTRVRSYKKLQEKYLPDSTLSLLPLAMRMAGPREVLLHALVRKNYGATHFIVGRDHAGPGNDKNGKPFYAPYEAQEAALKHADEIGIVIVLSKELAYLAEEKRYVPADEVPVGKATLALSGTEFRRKLLADEEIPEWFSFPEVIEELRGYNKKIAKDKNIFAEGTVFFFTGLSGAGKTTIAEHLKSYIENRYKRQVSFLDGDVVREHLSKGLGFSKEDRDINIERIGFVAGEIAKHGGIVICSPIAPYEETRKKNRERIEEVGRYIEIYVHAPLKILKKRDTKGLYHKAEMGLIKGMTGIDDPYEIPQKPDISIDTSVVSVDEAVTTIVDYLLLRAGK